MESETEAETETEEETETEKRTEMKGDEDTSFWKDRWKKDRMFGEAKRDRWTVTQAARR